MNDFFPQFRHLVVLMVCVGIFSGAATLLAGFETLSGVLYGCAAFCGVVALAWVNMLVSEAAAQRAVLRQDADTASMRAVAEFARAVEPKLPPAAFLRTMACAFPGLNLEDVRLPDEGAQEEVDEQGWVMKRGIPWGLATADQFRVLAKEYFDMARGLPIRYWTETQADQAEPVFTRRQFEIILDELVKEGMATRNTNGETVLNKAGEAWLRSHYSPTPDGFSKTRG